MRVVVIGATGNVGTSLVDALAAEAEIREIVGVARRGPDPEWAPPKTSFVAADVGRDDLRPIVAGADVVVHLAWLFQPTHAPAVTWQANAVGSLRVFDAVAAAGVPALVYASSVGAYSPGPDEPVTEEWPTHSLPSAGYGREKAYVERALDAFEACHPQVRVVRFRPGFIFKRIAGSSQRRLFAGPFLPGRLIRPGRLPVLPFPAGLRFQALHSFDAADAYRRAVVDGDARGAFNLAADPVLDARGVGEVLGARPVELPPALVRAGVAAAWHSRLIPAEPALFDLVMAIPLLDASRARRELGWSPRYSATAALAETIHGMAEGSGGPTPPLAADSVRGRLGEVATGVGQRSR